MEENPTVRKRTRQLGSISKSTKQKAMGEVVATKDHTDPIPVDEEVGEHPAYVMVKGAVTKNLGNYESIKVEVSIGMPCHNNMKAVEDTYKVISDKVDELIEREERLAKEGGVA